MSFESLAQCLLTARSNERDPSEEDIGGREEAQAFVMVVIVIPAEEVMAPVTTVPRIAKTAGVVGLILRGVKERLLVRVVVRDARPRVTAVDPEGGEQFGETVGCHGSTAVLVDDELAGLDAVARDGLREELLGESAVLTLGHHPRDDVAAEEVEDDVEVEEDAADEGGELRDVPGPDLVRSRGDEPRNRVLPTLSVVTPFAQFTALAEEPVHRPNRAEKPPLFEQGRVNLPRRLVDEAFRVQDGENLRSLRLRQPPVIRTTRAAHARRRRAKMAVRGGARQSQRRTRARHRDLRVALSDDLDELSSGASSMLGSAIP